MLTSLCCVQIFALDFASADRELKLAGGAVQAPERFARLAWGDPLAENAAIPVSHRLVYQLFGLFATLHDTK